MDLQACRYQLYQNYGLELSLPPGYEVMESVDAADAVIACITLALALTGPDHTFDGQRLLGRNGSGEDRMAPAEGLVLRVPDR